MNGDISRPWTAAQRLAFRLRSRIFASNRSEVGWPLPIAENTMIRATLVGVLVIVNVGCGPLATPMVVRLDAEDQAKVDDAWVNMFSPPNRLERELLLDTLISGQ